MCVGMSGRRRVLGGVTVAAVAALAVSGGAAGCSAHDKVARRSTSTTSIRTTSTTSTTTATTTTTAPLPPVAFAPLTALGVDAAGAALLGRPPLAIKLDNAVEALPHAGLERADVVFEIKVEGISRLMAVFHSTDAASVGPVRSARLSDPPILAMFGRPLFGWSGANDTVTADVTASSWIRNVDWVSLPGAYRRRGPHRAPHNLYTTTSELFARSSADQPAPSPIFEFLGVGQAQPGAAPAAGVNLRVGDTPSTWVWWGSGWLRWEYGRRHTTEDAGQVVAANVVILETTYAGEPKVPTAGTVGSGHAAVFSNGAVVEGTWIRSAITDRFALFAADGAPIRLAPGRTWIELTPGWNAGLIGADRAAELLASP